MTTLVRSASLTQFGAIAAGHGLDGAALAAEVGLPRGCLEDPDLRVPAALVGRLLELAAQRAGDPAFGLRMAQSRRLSNLGPLGLLVRDEPTLRHALEALVARIHLHNEALTVQVEQAGTLVLIRERLLHASGRPLPQSAELVVGVTFRVLSLFLGASWRPHRVCFSHAAPARRSFHQQVFGAPVEFGQEFDGMVCAAVDLDAPNPGADPVMARYTQRLLGQAPRAATGMADRVRELVVLLLPRGHCSVEQVALHLGVDRRTVARRLAAQGTHFSALVDGVRRELLERYLQDGTRALAGVSDLLGFSDPSAFSRWHRQRFGVTALSRRRAPAASPRH